MHAGLHENEREMRDGSHVADEREPRARERKRERAHAHASATWRGVPIIEAQECSRRNEEAE